MDWCGAAAIIALALLAQEDIRIAIEFDRLCLDLWNFRPDGGEWSLETAIVMGLLYAGEHSEEAGSLIKAYFDTLRSQRE